MILIRNAALYSPDYCGKKDLLIAGGKIIHIGNDLPINDFPVSEIIDMQAGHLVTPGFIDLHVHVAGAGGEGGPATRTPEAKLSQFIEAGITTVIGCLGTDGITRSVEEVLMRVKGLREEGISAWMYTGAYQLPTPSITGSVAKDIALIDEIIGIGEVAIADHRASNPDADELAKLGAEARIGGMLGNKAGIVHLHMGDAKDPFRIIHEAVSRSELNYSQFFPTHCNRNKEIFHDAKTYGKKGPIDITSSSYPYYPEYEVKPSRAIKELLEAGVPENHITMSSDACGSLPDFDKEGNLIRLDMGLPKANHQEFRDMVLEGMDVSLALKFITSNPARILKLKTKGCVKSGYDADIVCLDKDYQITDVIAKGKILMRKGNILKKNTY